jgi:hypothetical protein
VSRTGSRGSERCAEGCTCKKHTMPHLARWNASEGNRAHLHSEKMDTLRRAGVGPANPAWQGDDCTYGAAHDRVYRVRGAARDYKCTRCSRESEEWACNVDHPGTRPAKDTGALVNPDPTTYLPMCRPCHALYDSEHDGRHAWKRGPLTDSQRAQLDRLHDLTRARAKERAS